MRSTRSSPPERVDLKTYVCHPVVRLDSTEDDRPVWRLGFIRSLILISLTVLVLVGLFVLLRPNQSAEGPQTREFDLEIRGDTMEPSEVTLTEGDRVVLRITSESPVEVHLHGYDLEREVAPGEPTELSFKADLTGRFAIEDHETGEELGTLVVEPR